MVAQAHGDHGEFAVRGRLDAHGAIAHVVERLRDLDRLGHRVGVQLRVDAAHRIAHFADVDDLGFLVREAGPVEVLPQPRVVLLLVERLGDALGNSHGARLGIHQGRPDGALAVALDGGRGFARQDLEGIRIDAPHQGPRVDPDGAVVEALVRAARAGDPDHVGLHDRVGVEVDARDAVADAVTVGIVEDEERGGADGLGLAVELQRAAALRAVASGEQQAHCERRARPRRDATAECTAGIVLHLFPPRPVRPSAPRGPGGRPLRR